MSRGMCVRVSSSVHNSLCVCFVQKTEWQAPARGLGDEVHRGRYPLLCGPQPSDHHLHRPPHGQIFAVRLRWNRLVLFSTCINQQCLTVTGQTSKYPILSHILLLGKLLSKRECLLCNHVFLCFPTVRMGLRLPMSGTLKPKFSTSASGVRYVTPPLICPISLLIREIYVIFYMENGWNDFRFQC